MLVSLILTLLILSSKEHCQKKKKKKITYHFEFRFRFYCRIKKKNELLQVFNFPSLFNFNLELFCNEFLSYQFDQ